MVPKHLKMRSIYFDSVTSTMDEALNYIDDEEESIIAIIAKEQTRGRGRGERSWISPKGGYYVTYIIPLEKELSEEKLAFFHYAAALAIQEMLHNSFLLKSKIKWPNDIYINEKKIAGILIEYIMGEKCYILIGIGVNVNIKPSDFPSYLVKQTTNLQVYIKNEIDLKKIGIELSKSIKKNTLYVVESKLDELVNNFNSHLSYYQRQILLKNGTKYYCKGIDNKGNLVLEKNSQRIALSINDSDEIA